MNTNLTMLIFFCLPLTSFCFLNVDLMIAFSKSKNLTLGAIFSCASKRDRVHASKMFHKENLRYVNANFNNMEKNDISIGDFLFRKYYHYGVILDADCGDWDLKISQLDKTYFYEFYHWLLLSASKENVIKVFEAINNININCDINLAVPSDENSKNWTIFDLYNPASQHGGTLKVDVLGYYTKNEGYRAKMVENKYWNRKNMTGVHFKSAIVIPNLEGKTLNEYLSSDEKRETNSMHRFQSVAINHCRDMYNFSLSIQRTNSWGYIQADGHFDGLVSLLERKMVDFGSSPLIYKLDRMPVIDYGYGNWILRSTFIYRRPKVIAKSYEIFLRPLETNVWTTIVMILSVIMVALKITFATETVLIRKRQENDDVDASWSFLILFTLGAFCQQGATCYPKLICSRILAVFVFLFCILIYQFYSASIVSYLLMDPPRSIDDLKDLVDSSLHVGVEDILIDRAYFVQTTDPNAIKLFETKIKHTTNNSGFYTPEEGLEKVREGGFAFHVETSTGYPIIESTFSNEEICDLEEIQMYRTQPMHTNLQKNSPFREMLNYCMLKLVDVGNMYRLRKYWDARKPTCIESAKKIEIHVSIKEFSCGLIVLSYGILFSLIFLLVEVILAKRKEIIGKIFRNNKVTPFQPYVN